MAVDNIYMSKSLFCLFDCVGVKWSKGQLLNHNFPGESA